MRPSEGNTSKTDGGARRLFDSGAHHAETRKGPPGEAVWQLATATLFLQAASHDVHASHKHEGFRCMLYVVGRRIVAATLETRLCGRLRRGTSS